MINMENREIEQIAMDKYPFVDVLPRQLGYDENNLAEHKQEAFIEGYKLQNKQLLNEIEMLKELNATLQFHNIKYQSKIDKLQFELKAADSVNEQLTENQIPEYLIEFVDDVKHMIKLYNNSSHTRSEEYRDKLAEKLDDIRTIDLKP